MLFDVCLPADLFIQPCVAEVDQNTKRHHDGVQEVEQQHVPFYNLSSHLRGACHVDMAVDEQHLADHGKDIANPDAEVKL